MAFLSGLVFTLLSCSSKEKQVDCPTVEQEPISVCRAQLKCHDLRHGPRFGVGLGMGVSSNVGVGVGAQTRATDYAACLDRDLAAQKKDREARSPTTIDK